MDRSIGSKSLMTMEELRFTVRVEKFSMHQHKDCSVSPKFKSESAEWSLNVTGYQDCQEIHNDEFIRVDLIWNVNEPSSKIGYIVKVNAYVLNVFGFSEKPLLMQESCFRVNETGSTQVLTLTKDKVSDFCGLKKILIFPNDSLTISCNLVIYRENVRSFITQTEFDDSSETTIQHACSRKEYFSHSTVTVEKFDFRERFENFPFYFTLYSETSQRLTSCEYQNGHSSNGGRWSLVIDICDYGYVRLLRQGGCRKLFVEVKLSVVNYFGVKVLCGEKKMYFRGSQNEDLSFVTLDRNQLCGWYGLKRLFLMPNDTLTLHCDLMTYEKNTMSFEEEADFLASLKNQRNPSNPLWHLLTYGTACNLSPSSSFIIKFLTCLLRLVVIIGLFYITQKVVLFFIYYCLQNITTFIVYALVFAIGIVVLFKKLCDIKICAENVEKCK